MLGKLIKYELKSTSYWFLPVYLLALLLAPIERFMIYGFDNSVEMGRFMVNLAKTPWDKISLIAFSVITFTYALALTTVAIASVLLIIYRFYKNLTTNEGYLMHTLPVKTSHLIWSKAIAGMIWTSISVIVICISALILVIGTKEWNEAIQIFSKFCTEFMKLLHDAHINVLLLLIEFFISAIISGLFFIFKVYASIAIGQLFQKYRIIASIGAFFVLNTAIQFLTALVAIPTVTINLTQYQNSINTTLNLYILISIFGMTTLTAILYFITWYIFKNRLNLE